MQMAILGGIRMPFIEQLAERDARYIPVSLRDGGVIRG